MDKKLFNAIILVICNSNLLYAELRPFTTDLKALRGKRDLQHKTQSVDNYFSNFNDVDNDITTVLPDSDVPANMASSERDNLLVSHLLDDGTHYFRSSMDNRVLPEVDLDGTSASGDNEYTPFDKHFSDDYTVMRGKKFFSLYPMRFNLKRAPSGFLGLRGKKYYDGIKRVPSGFTGVRGKKADYEMSNNNDDNDAELGDDADFYELLQKEKKLLDDIEEIYRVNHGLTFSPALAIEDAFRAAEKRVPSGFVGMRGKKAVGSNGGYFGGKRAPSGFLGLRGKRENAIIYSGDDKRGSFTSFFGTRGKKEPMMPNGFVQRNQLNELSWPDIQLLMERNRTPPKRVPNGFMGVRGKKWTDINFDD